MKEPLPQSIAQAPRKTAADGRIVVTLKYKISKEERDALEYPHNIDAIDVLRFWVERYHKGEVTLDWLIENAEAIEIAAAK